MISTSRTSDFQISGSAISSHKNIHSIITSNRLHSFYPGMVVLEGNSSENMVSSNHFLRTHEPWPPMQAHNNRLNDLYGIVYISGSNNSVIANHFSEIIDRQYLVPEGTIPVIVHIASGNGNYISSNHIVAATESSEASAAMVSSCFSTQVANLMVGGKSETLEVTTVVVDQGSVGNTILDSGTEYQVEMNKSLNAFRATPLHKM